MAAKGERVWFVQVNDQSWGPYTSTELWQWLTEGRLTADAPCWQEGQDTPMTLSQAIALPPAQSVFAEGLVFPSSPSPGVSRADMATPLASPSPDMAHWDEAYAPAVVDLNRVLRMAALLVLAVAAYFGYKSLMPAARPLPPSPPARVVIQQPLPVRVDPYQEKINERTEISTLMENGRQAVQQGSLAEARRCYEAVMAKCGDRPEFVQQVEDAGRALLGVDLTQHPDKRFVLHGATVGASTVVKIYDTRDAREYKVRPEESFGEFRLDSYDGKAKSAEISGNGRSYTITHP
jgi:hypothetical protein